MIIDLTKLITNIEEVVVINSVINIPLENFKNTSIRKLENIYFTGKIIKLCDDTGLLTGILKGEMILPDDVTLEDTNYSFTTEIEENIEIFEKTLDIIPILWQNIVVEIPLQVINERNKNLKLKGDGWRLITEDDIATSNDSPFNNLKELLDERKE